MSFIIFHIINSVCACVCSSCDMSSASVQMMEAVDQDLDLEDAGKLTEDDKAHTGRVGPALRAMFVSVLLIIMNKLKT